LDVALGDPIVVMGADTSKERFLIELEKILSEGFGRKVGSVVEKVLLGDDSGVSTHQFKGLLGLESLRRTESGLQLDMDVPGSGIDKDAASLVHLALFCFALAGEETASSGADEVIDRDPLAGEELILSKSIHTVSNNRSSDSRGRPLLLLGELASGAHGRIDETRTGRVEPSRAL
jgi:hypothetical protein